MPMPTGPPRNSPTPLIAGSRRSCAHSWDRLLLCSGVLVMTIFLPGGFGYWLGNAHSEAAVQQTEAGLRAACADEQPGA